jgi:hypothetical protein
MNVTSPMGTTELVVRRNEVQAADDQRGAAWWRLLQRVAVLFDAQHRFVRITTRYQC